MCPRAGWPPPAAAAWRWKIFRFSACELSRARGPRYQAHIIPPPANGVHTASIPTTTTTSTTSVATPNPHQAPAHWRTISDQYSLLVRARWENRGLFPAKLRKLVGVGALREIHVTGAHKTHGIHMYGSRDTTGRKAKHLKAYKII